VAERLHLAVSLDGAGYHEAAWRDPTARPTELFSARYWVDQVELAERGLLDLVSFEDTFGIQSQSPRKLDERTDHVRGRLEAVLLACRVAPVTRHIGLVPIATTTHTEPFHIASAVSTLDWISKGRAGWQPRVSGRPADIGLVGIRTAPDPAEALGDLFEEATDAVEVVRRLWDSWEDDAIIKDVATGRFVDRDKLHYIEFEGRSFSVKGPSIVPRPPQGQPLVAVLAHQPIPWAFAATSGDVVFITPADAADVATWVGHVRDAESTTGRTGTPLKVLADLVVFLAPTSAAARDRKAALDELAGRRLLSDAAIFTGTPDDLAAELLAWRDHGLDGFRLRPGVTTVDLPAIVDGVVPALQRAGAFRTAYEPGTLRERFGLGRPANRYTTTGSPA
jgi:alkanesulfonate monooxygenase SsuD/methylene tetrahydromethanopterin reductase-like flavin-dependent oxidoreductase (luciferase family)